MQVFFRGSSLYLPAPVAQAQVALSQVPVLEVPCLHLPALAVQGDAGTSGQSASLSWADRPLVPGARSAGRGQAPKGEPIGRPQANFATMVPSDLNRGPSPDASNLLFQQPHEVSPGIHQEERHERGLQFSR